MTAILKFPFQLMANGRAATIDDSTPEGQAQLIGQLLTTRQGERPLVAAFGLADPVFRGVTEAELRAAITTWGPAVTVDSVTITYNQLNNTQTVVVDFT